MNHEMKDKFIEELQARIYSLQKYIIKLEMEQQINELVKHNEFLQAQVEILHKDIANIHYNQIIEWTETD